MPDKSSETTTVKFEFDVKAVETKLETIKKSIDSVAGKKGHNPYVWAAENVTPLQQRFIGNKDQKVAPERSKELFDKIMALPDSPPQFFTPTKEENPFTIPLRKPVSTN